MNSREEQINPKEAADITEFPAEGEFQITAVEQLRKPRSRYLIHFGMYTLSVHEDVMIKYRMLKGNIFTKEELLDIVIADERQRAYVEALKFLGLKPRTVKEIEDRLQLKGMSAEAAEITLARLIREGLVDDEVYAKQWVEQRINRHKKGRMWVRQELRQKGINTKTIAEALGEISEQAEMESAYAAGSKKWRQTKGDLQERKRKTGAYLMRRGYPGELTRKVINRLIQENNEDGEELEFFD